MLDDGIKQKMNGLNLGLGNALVALILLDYEFSGEDEVEYEV